MADAVWWIDGPKLRALRVARGLSIGQLAQQAQVSQPTLPRLERSDGPGRLVWPPMVVAIAASLGVPVEELLAGDVAAFRAALEGLRPKP